jgi:hypothetical protein
MIPDRASARGWLACVLVLALAWGAWLHRLGVTDLDDAASNELIFSRQPLSTIVARLPWTDQSPLSFVVLHFWRLWGEGPATVKALNLTLLTASLLVLYALGRRLCRPRVALAAVALAALSPASLWVARSGRMYSLQLLLWVVSVYFAVGYAERRQPRDLAAFALASVLSTYNHFIGFVSTATAVLWLLVEAWEAMRSSPRETQAEREEARRRLLGPPLAAALAIFLLVQPQAMRMLALLQAPPAVVPGQAVPGGWVPFLDAVSWFWFMGADWGPLRAREGTVRAVYLAAAYLLFVMGLARGSARMRRLVVVTVLLPLVPIGLAAGHMDFRDRHLLYMLPLVWLSMVNGALGADREGVPVPAAMRRAAAAILVTVGAASAWLLYQKLPEGYVEWTKLMSGLAQLHRPGMAVYMAPGPLTGTPTLVASQVDPTGGLEVRPLNEDTRQEFVAEAEGRRDFALLTNQWSPPDAEHDWRARHLEARGYHRLALHVTGATAQVFTAGEGPAFAAVTKLAAKPSPGDVVAWARGRATDASRPRTAATAWGRPLVARVDADGAARESTFFTSQRGESGYWRLSAVDGDAVEEARVGLGDAQRQVLLARPTAGSLLIIVFPEREAAVGLRLSCGGAPPIGQRKVGVVAAEVYLDGDLAAQSTCPLGRWNETFVDTSRVGASAADVTVALTAVGMEAAEIALRLDRSRRGGSPATASSPPPGPVTLTAGRTLKDDLDRLRVSRVGAAGFGRVPALLETAPRSAAEMHEAAAAGDGGLQARWQLGDLPWDAVGVTRQRIAGEARSGLWAHPKEGTTLVIEADAAALAGGLEGFYGLTDYSVGAASAAGISDPVHFRIFLDGRPLLSRDVPRARGWNRFDVDLAVSPPAAGRLRIEVDAARDDWAHFVFDLGSRAAGAHLTSSGRR